jgi:RNA polymerase sigma-70 factor (ECF subfamily)
LTIEKIIDGCRNNDRVSQKKLYSKYSPILFGICRRYVKDFQEAEDVLVEGFIKIFGKINTFEGRGSFEGWMKHIMVNECLMHLRKRKLVYNGFEYEIPVKHKAIENLKYNDIIEMVNLLPNGYRTIFNLYVIEGFKHREIAEKLGISINTSKSQLILAKKKLRGIFLDKNEIK